MHSNEGPSSRLPRESQHSSSDPKARGREGKSFHSPQEDSRSIHPTLAPGLYITATPIGNAADITLRALNVLAHCDAIVAEDTRVTSRLLAIHGISRPLLVYNDHNAPSVRPKLLERLRDGARLALVSDAGTPLVSDPGYKLVTAARDAGIAVYSLPGPSAALAALTLSGLPSERFCFSGFLPSKSGERRSMLEELRVIPATLILFESPQRLAESLRDMAEVFGPRQAAVARELTKLHEEVRKGSLLELARFYDEKGAPRGEITLVIGPPEGPKAADSAQIDALLLQLLPYMPVRPAADFVADIVGGGRRVVYSRALALKGAKAADDRGD